MAACLVVPGDHLNVQPAFDVDVVCRKECQQQAKSNVPNNFVEAKHRWKSAHVHVVATWPNFQCSL